MTESDFLALGASIGACASALAGFFTVREIAKQRQATYRPEIVPSSLPFVARKNPLVESTIPDTWMENLPFEVENPAAQAAISIINIGLGAARHAEIRWSFDIQGAVNTANTLAQEAFVTAFFELKDGELSMKSAGGDRSTSMWSNQVLERLDYILPATTTTSPIKATVPHAYRQLVAAIVYFSGKKQVLQFPMSLPELRLDISYVDIAGSRHKVKYILSTQVSMMANKGEYFHGRIEGARCS